MSRRDVELIALALEKGEDLGVFARDWLKVVCRRALEGDPDPFGMRPRRGGQPKAALHIAIAEEVARLYWDEGHTLEKACALAGERFNRSGADGGTANKAFTRHRDSIEVSRLIYSARNAQRDLDATESARLAVLFEKMGGRK